AAVEAAVARFTELGVMARTIPVSHAFHSAIVAPATEPLQRVLSGLTLGVPQVPLLSNIDASLYPSDRAGILDVMGRQMASPVEFIAQVERMYEMGARIFIEVGPRKACAGFVENILQGREHHAVFTNNPKRPDVE